MGQRAKTGRCALIITSLYAALLTILFLVLSARVITYRRSEKISLGDGEDPVLQRRTRAQANCAEYAPFGILMMAIAETLSASPFVIHLMGGLLLVGRLMHAYGVGGPGMNMSWRVRGMILTLTSLGIGAAVNLVSVALGTI